MFFATFPEEICDLCWISLTYNHTKNKRGIVGDPGIRGQTGNKGQSAICEADCGRKICFINVTEHANNVLNNDLDKVRGMIELKYDVDLDKAYKAKKRILRQFVNKLRIRFGVFSLPTDDNGSTSSNFVKIFVKDDGLRIRVSNSKEIVDGIINDLNTGNDNSKKYLNVYINGPKPPTMILETLEALNKCILETSEDYVPEKGETENNNKILVEECTDNPPMFTTTPFHTYGTACHFPFKSSTSSPGTLSSCHNSVIVP